MIFCEGWKPSVLNGKRMLLWIVTKVCLCYISAKSFQLGAYLDIFSTHLLTYYTWVNNLALQKFLLPVKITRLMPKTSISRKFVWISLKSQIEFWNLKISFKSELFLSRLKIRDKSFGHEIAFDIYKSYLDIICSKNFQ
jgi:hypothetical protein